MKKGKSWSDGAASNQLRNQPANQTRSTKTSLWKVARQEGTTHFDSREAGWLGGGGGLKKPDLNPDGLSQMTFSQTIS